MRNVWYSLLVDETITDQNVKQFDMHVRYWSTSEDNRLRSLAKSESEMMLWIMININNDF